MDGKRFDNLTRSLAGRSTRRSLLKRFSALTAAGVAARAGVPAAAEGECEEGFILCGATCVDPSSDVYHCGECGNFCGGVPRPGYSSIGQCIAGECEAVCLPEYSECGETCVDLSSDVYNCGSCGNFCGGVPGPGYASVGECIGGECHAVCLPDADDCGGVCTDVGWDVHNCGACGNHCAVGEICCSGNCVGPNSAERFCDSCGFQGGWPQGCLPNEVCSGGLCVATESSAGTEENTAPSEGSGGQPQTSSPAADAAYQLSVLEANGDFDGLYDLMHPDAQIVIPRGAVLYWYQQYFAPQGPQPISVVDETSGDWTWEVIGRTYPGTAIVSFTQTFTNGDTVNDAIRLVQDVDGDWRWFFGRSAEFVEGIIQESIDAGAVTGDQPVPEAAGVAAGSLFSETIVSLDGIATGCLTAESILTASPEQLQGAERGEVQTLSETGETLLSYLPRDRAAGDAYPDLLLTITPLSGGETPESMVAGVQASIDNWEGPEFSSPPRALNPDLVPDSDYLISYFEEFTEVMGFVPVVTWGIRGGSELYSAAGPAIVALNELAFLWQEAITSDASCAA